MSPPLPFRFGATSARRSSLTEARDAGRVMLSDRSEHCCETLAISVLGARLRAPVRGRVGETVVCYLDRFGRVEGRIGTVFDDGFTVDFKASPGGRERLASKLADAAQADPAPPCLARCQPIQRRAVLVSPEGRRLVVQMLEITLTGATFTGPVPLAVGQAVVLGTTPASVERCVQRLTTVRFGQAIAPDRFGPDLVL